MFVLHIPIKSFWLQHNDPNTLKGQTFNFRNLFWMHMEKGKLIFKKRNYMENKKVEITNFRSPK